jgi:hypothetical protein
MTSQVRLVVGHDDQMESAGRDDRLAAGADVLLARRVRLHRGDGYPEKIAHARTANIATNAITTATMSAVLFSWSRNGLNPIC